MKKVTDAEFTVVKGRSWGIGRPKADAEVYVRKELPRWFKVFMYGLVLLLFLGLGLEKAKQASGQPSVLDKPTAAEPLSGTAPQ